MANLKLTNDTSITMSMLMTPAYGNFSGYVHGGEILKMFDQVAYVCARKYAKSYVVTLSAENVFFFEKISIGSLLTFYASINYTGSSSMEVGIRVQCEDIDKNTQIHTNSCYFTMVSMDENGKAKKLKPFVPKSDIEKKRYKDAQKRREVRNKKYKSFKQSK